MEVANLTEVWEAAVPGLVGGFILNGACGLNGGGLVGGGFVGAAPDELVDGLVDGAVLVVGVGGNGLFGGSVAGGGVCGRLSSFDGGNGGIDIFKPSPFSLHKPSSPNRNPISFSNPSSFSMLQSGPAPFVISHRLGLGRLRSMRPKSVSCRPVLRRCPADDTMGIQPSLKRGRDR